MKKILSIIAIAFVFSIFNTNCADAKLTREERRANRILKRMDRVAAREDRTIRKINETRGQLGEVWREQAKRGN